MRIRAVMFDVYGTLLEAGPPPLDAAQQWLCLCRAHLGERRPALCLESFNTQCQRIIEREHKTARAQGVPHPEVYWPAVACEALPALETFSEAELDEFLFRHAQLQHGIRLTSGAARFLTELAGEATLLGVASNAQAYTIREFQSALITAGLNPSIFQRDLCFWSFEHGFGKPDPHVFQILAARLRARRIYARETLMVGDRLDNDIEPAKAHGWHTWQMSAPTDEEWAKLRRALFHPEHGL
ncbi:MAG: HAD family hydrolase [Verrucomicrobia bacterium]|nr:HAD family hydrolase [Verrucomicrobiota bacterium]